MNNIPKTIFLSIDEECEATNDFSEIDPEFVYWSENSNDGKDIRYRLVERVFYIDEVRKLLNQLRNEEISMSKLVEALNEKATGLEGDELNKLLYKF